MDNILEKSLDVISHVLENAAFLFIDPLDEQSRPSESTWRPMGVTLEFHGETDGKLTLWAEEGFMRYVAANILGISEDNDFTAEIGIDSLKELLNMIVGHYLTTIYGAEPVFEVGIPRVLPQGNLNQDFQAENTIWLQVDNYPLLFVVSPLD